MFRNVQQTVLASVSLVFLLVIAIVQYEFFKQDGILAQVNNLQSKIAEQVIVNEQLKIRNQNLTLDILELKSGSSLLEERARMDLGLIKPGEVLYVLP